MTQAQTLREEKLARMVDHEVAPVWHDRFARLIWRFLPGIDSGTVLDVHAGSGRGTEELLERLDPGVRVLALEPSAALRNLAKSRVSPRWRNRVYLKPGDMGDITDMPDGAYDLVVANLVLSEAQDIQQAVAELVRVTKPGGSVLATLPMEGTWAEAEDLLREVLIDANMPAATQRLRRLAGFRQTGADLAAVPNALGIPQDHVVITRERFTLLFGSGREFLFSPLVEFGPLRLWKAIVAKEGNPQEIFFRLKEAIDTYYDGRVFSVSAVAGLVHLTRPGAAHGNAAYRAYWSEYPELDALFSGAAQRAAMSEEEDDDMDFHIEVDEGAEAEPPRGGRRGISPEDEAFLALLSPSAPEEVQPDRELDVLLDQVLEFDARPAESIEEILDEELVEVDGMPDRYRPGETLQRIKALLPPAPSEPPPLPRKKKR